MSEGNGHLEARLGELSNRLKVPWGAVAAGFGLLLTIVWVSDDSIEDRITEMDKKYTVEIDRLYKKTEKLETDMRRETGLRFDALVERLIPIENFNDNYSVFRKNIKNGKE